MREVADYDVTIVDGEDVEQATLGVMLWTRGTKIKDVVPVLPLDMGPWFGRKEHEELYRVLVEMWTQGLPIDFLVVEHELKRRNKMQAVGGRDYLLDLAQLFPNPENGHYYASMVKEAALRRRGIAAAGDILEAIGHDSSMQATEILDEGQRALQDLRQAATIAADGFTEKDITAALALTSGHDGELPGLPTGLQKLNETLLGLRRGQMIVLAGRPGMGKTSLALNIAQHLAMVKGIPVWFVSLEMTGEELLVGLSCMWARVNSQRLSKKLASQDEIDRYAAALEAVRDCRQLHLTTKGTVRLEELQAMAERKRTENGIQAVFVDYLQKVVGPRSESRQQEVAAISRGLKSMALNMDLPVIALAQLNRAVEGRTSHRPYISDLRESGAIEADADVVALLHRPAYYGEEGQPYLAELDIAKNRRGPTGIVKLHFDPAFTKFNDLTCDDQANGPYRYHEDFIPTESPF